VCFNGKTAGRMEPVFAEWGFETIVLPSSSPANTMRFDEKLGQWRQIAKGGSALPRSAGGSSASPRVPRVTPHALRLSRSKC
jgi:hypothetical protein